MDTGIYDGVLVTGSNWGIGLELVRQLAESATPPSQIFALKDLLQKHLKLITIIPLDTSDPASIKETSGVVGSQLGDGSLSLLTNNAGVNIQSNLQDTGMKEMVDVYVTNVVGSHSMPAIINVSSVLSSIEKCSETFAEATMYPYRTSKAPLAVADSASGMLRVISSLTSTDSGTLLDWEGNGIPW
ncbi:uncharacterized protein zgc:158868 [Anguilla anguilla]|uniref:uncharacterized protein zgc:158868 n=1 Tax=Anguilla anguilla TaxID=7936 RepID=UPI0015AD8C3D|nr:uncharacterized protein zgc:158868 [Anguilla anguilla]